MDEAQVSLHVSDVVKRFGGVTALDGVSVQMRPGETLGLIGPNGSGKTTLINCLSGVIKPDSGRILLHGRDLAARRPHLVARAGVRRTFQHSLVSPDLSVLENVLLGASDRLTGWRSLFSSTGSQAREARRDALECLGWVGMAASADRPARAVSGPALKLVELARCLVGRPEVLLLDEVAAGLNSQEKAHLAGLIETIPHQLNCAVLLVEHDLEFVRSLVGRLVVLDAGRVMSSGTPEAVFAQEEVIRAYIGN